jgi:hypothetical protein
MAVEHLIVRLGTPALLVGSCAGAAAVSWHLHVSEIPSFAFRSHVVLAVQVALLFFYAALLLLEGRREEIKYLRQELAEVEEALERVAEQAIKRIDASVEKVMSRGSRG